MDWLNSLFTAHSEIQAVVVLSLICALGLSLGKVKIFGVSLDIAFVFFIGIVAGHFGLQLNPQMLAFAETFGLTIFVYTLGLYVGPNFFGSLRKEGMSLNLWALAIILFGTLLALIIGKMADIPIYNMVGILCGATTNTPALGAAQQTLAQLGMHSGGAALACAITYPLGVVGVIIAMIFLRKCFIKPDDLLRHVNHDEDHTYVGQFEVANPALKGKTIKQIGQMTNLKFLISRIWRGKEVVVPLPNTQLKKGDNVLIVMTDDELMAMELLFGKKVNKDWNAKEVDWNHIDNRFESRTIVMTRHAINGKKLGRLHLRNLYGVNVSRVMRGDIKLLATYNLRLQYGDRVTIVGEHKALDNAEKFFGNAVKSLDAPNIGSIFLGVLVGLIVGTIPLTLPGISVPVKLGIAGGPIIIGIIVGALGSRLKFISYTTGSASLMLRRLGLSLYLACLGLAAGRHFFEIVVRPEGLLWIGLGFVLTVIPVLIVGFIAVETRKFNFGSICGVMCGAMANPMALGYANDTVDNDSPAISYATVYPLGMFIRVLIAQLVVMFFV